MEPDLTHYKLGLEYEARVAPSTPSVQVTYVTILEPLQARWWRPRKQEG